MAAEMKLIPYGAGYDFEGIWRDSMIYGKGWGIKEEKKLEKFEIEKVENGFILKADGKRYVYNSETALFKAISKMLVK